MSQLVPSPEQQAIIDLGLTSIKVRAGAGTGKTTTVAMVIANLVQKHNVRPEQVLGITFTNKAAAELSERIATLVGGSDPSQQVEVHTYHGFAAQVLGEFGPLAGVDSRLRVITPTFARQLLSETFFSSQFEHLDLTQTRSLDKISRFGDRLGDHLITPDRVLDLATTDDVGAARHEMAQVLEQYTTDKRSLGVVDYSDLVTLATSVMVNHPQLAVGVRDRYRVVVLDEYQDTNPAQRTLLSAIFTDGFPTIAVGDEDQTIYEWRGASAENFEMFPQQFRTADGEPAHELGLTLNRRSVQPILDIANQVRANASYGADRLNAPETDQPPPTEILAHWTDTALTEAEWVASNFERIHREGAAWSSMAILFRKNKDFAVMIDTFNRHDIPVEVANIGGLMTVPEVADLRAWLEVLDEPGASPALTRILLGSKFRLGLADLAVISRQARSMRPPANNDDEEPDPVSLVESIEQLDQIDDLRDGAKTAIGKFWAIYRDLVMEIQGRSLVEACRLVLDVTGAWGDVEALPATARLTARLNLYRFLDLAEEWSPLRGRPTLPAFLAYLRDMEAEPGDDLDAARLSGEDAVTFITVHRSKGLEWDTVALPALTEGNFPSSAQTYPNPLRFPEFVPTPLRIDQVFQGVAEDVDSYHKHLQTTHLRQEWRTAYVAVTRARHRLLASGAYWYGHPEPNKNPAKRSLLWDIVANSPHSTTTQTDDPIERPLVLRPHDDQPAPDPVFAGGWEEGLRMAIEDPTEIDRLSQQAEVHEPYLQLVDELSDRLFALDFETDPVSAEPEPVVSVTGLVTYAECPKSYYWTSVDPLPRRPSMAARRGTEVHRQIELHQRGHVPLDLAEPDNYDLPSSDPTSSQHPGALSTYLESRFASAKATLIEAPFALPLESGFKVRGRIDAVYIDDDRWEVVDFKSGQLRDDPARMVQLQAYAVAVSDLNFGLPPPQDLVVTFAYLGGGGGEISEVVDQEWLTQARSTLETHTSNIAVGNFQPTPGEWCRGCDFLRFCEPGKNAVREQGTKKQMEAKPNSDHS